MVGLGNPEGKYFRTWHNLGFQAAELFAGNATFKKKGNQLLAETRVGDSKVLVLKPLTYMNLSGQAVLAVARKYRLATPQIIVLVDDIYLPVGTVRLKKSGSAGGHNGLKSIIELLHATDFVKIKIGAQPLTPIKGNTADYVLSRIPDNLQATVAQSLADAVAIAHDVIKGVK